MSDKIYQLLEKMYIEFTGRFEKVDAKFDKVDARFDQVDARFEKVDARFDQVDARFDKVDARFDKVDARFDKLEKEVKQNSKDILRLETVTTEKFGALFDAQKMTNERLDRIETKLDRFCDKVEDHEIRLQVIDGGKNKKMM